MDRKPVGSSNLRSVGYDELSRTLEIEFHNGRVYRYGQIPLGIYEGLMNAVSKGRYFALGIKDKYPYARIK